MRFGSLENEARKVQELAHPNIVTVYRFRSRRKRDLHRHGTAQRPHAGSDLVREAKACRAGSAVRPQLDSMESAQDWLTPTHRACVHADLKPANVFVGAEGRVKLLDFGIASATRAGGYRCGHARRLHRRLRQPGNDGRRAARSARRRLCPRLRRLHAPDGTPSRSIACRVSTPPKPSSTRRQSRELSEPEWLAVEPRSQLAYRNERQDERSDLSRRIFGRPSTG